MLVMGWAWSVDGIVLQAGALSQQAICQCVMSAAAMDGYVY
jgi:hypothetical protein